MSIPHHSSPGASHAVADSETFIETLRARLLDGEDISEEEALQLVELLPAHRGAIRALAAEITHRFHEPGFDSCSIVNARSGRCPENCKWCAQSAHFRTDCDTYPLISRDTCMRHADACREAGIRRFSMVTSGRKMQGADLETACDYAREMNERGGLDLCASMGLLNEDELLKLWEAGIRRYHCNLEAAPEFFATLCSTHTVEDKIRTINAARKIGFEICSGGIIGMGETMRQRALLALELRRVAPASIPINILCPIPGTPLADSKPLDTDEILDTVAIFRVIHPRPVLRFAGGRASLSRDAQLEAMRIGINGAIVGDLLTTVGSTVAEDRDLAARARLGWK